jgi:hypothetical protein
MCNQKGEGAEDRKRALDRGKDPNLNGTNHKVSFQRRIYVNLAFDK